MKHAFDVSLPSRHRNSTNSMVWRLPARMPFVMTRMLLLEENRGVFGSESAVTDSPAVRYEDAPPLQQSLQTCYCPSRAVKESLAFGMKSLFQRGRNGTNSAVTTRFLLVKNYGRLVIRFHALVASSSSKLPRFFWLHLEVAIKF